MEAFGVSGDKLPEKQDSVFEVFPENEEALTIFLRCCTQWRASAAGLLGLDYTALFQVMELYGTLDRKDVLESIQVIEGVVLSKLNERKGD